jgi:hypothetical protein
MCPVQSVTHVPGLDPSFHPLTPPLPAGEEFWRAKPASGDKSARPAELEGCLEARRFFQRLPVVAPKPHAISASVVVPIRRRPTVP